MGGPASQRASRTVGAGVPPPHQLPVAGPVCWAALWALGTTTGRALEPGRWRAGLGAGVRAPWSASPSTSLPGYQVWIPGQSKGNGLLWPELCRSWSGVRCALGCPPQPRAGEGQCCVAWSLTGRVWICLPSSRPQRFSGAVGLAGRARLCPLRARGAEAQPVHCSLVLGTRGPCAEPPGQAGGRPRLLGTAGLTAPASAFSSCRRGRGPVCSQPVGGPCSPQEVPDLWAGPSSQGWEQDSRWWPQGYPGPE